MNITHLKYAVEVEKTGSITHAAKNLYMGQPNLSKAIKELESTLGIVIFRRTPKGIGPTKKGEEFLTYAKSIISQIDEIESLYDPEKRSQQGISISVPRASYVSHALTRYVAGLDYQKDIEINFKETNSMRAISDVAQGDFSMGIIRYELQNEPYFKGILTDKDLRGELVWEFEYVALMSREHPLAGCEQLLYKDVCKYVEIIHGDVSLPSVSAREAQTELSGEKPEQARRRIYVYERGSQFDLLRNVPETYMWVSPIPSVVLECNGLTQKPCHVANHKYRDMLIYPAQKKFSEQEKDFIDKLHEVRDELSRA